jgi:hypothetical protein
MLSVDDEPDIGNLVAYSAHEGKEKLVNKSTPMAYIYLTALYTVNHNRTCMAYGKNFIIVSKLSGTISF